MKYEYVITAGTGRLVEFGVKAQVDGFSEKRDVIDVAVDAIYAGHAIQAEPCADDCETGQ
jgi:hypothetical protein